MKKYKSQYSIGSSGGIGIFGVAQIVLLILKWTNLIDLPWSQVLIPFWIELGITIFILLLWLGFNLFHNWRKKK